MDEYKKLLRPYREDGLTGIGIVKDGQEIMATKEEIDKCVEYLKNNNRLVRHKTVKDTVVAYLKGEIDLSEMERLSDTKKIENLVEEIAEVDKKDKEVSLQIETEKAKNKELKEEVKEQEHSKEKNNKSTEDNEAHDEV